MSDKEEEPMKTHREHLMEKLEAQRQPQEASFGTAHMRHLLLFADVLDEREATHLPGVRKLIETPTSEPKALDSTRRAMDRIAASVLRFHGGEVLRRVREKAEKIETHFRDGSDTKQSHMAKGAIKDFVAIVDDELAKLGHLTATDKPTRQCRHGLDGCALFENFAGALRLCGFVVAKPTLVNWIEVSGILNEVIDAVTKPEGKFEASAPNPLDKLRERFTYTPEPGDGDGGKWVKRSDVLNAIDEIDTPA